MRYVRTVGQHRQGCIRPYMVAGRMPIYRESSKEVECTRRNSGCSQASFTYPLCRILFLFLYVRVGVCRYV